MIDDLEIQRCTRFIPACAGNSVSAVTIGCYVAVHPRVCGEQDPVTGGSPADTGSSPRVRGTVRNLGQVQQARRFIPACAGNRPSVGSDCRRTPVHPRVCGEQRRPATCSTTGRGSSPRVRGTVGGGVESDSFCRFIPACAGNSNPRCPAAVPQPVHPRVCGEQI